MSIQFRKCSTLSKVEYNGVVILRLFVNGGKYIYFNFSQYMRLKRIRKTSKVRKILKEGSEEIGRENYSRFSFLHSWYKENIGDKFHKVSNPKNYLKQNDLYVIIPKFFKYLEDLEREDKRSVKINDYHNIPIYERGYKKLTKRFRILPYRVRLKVLTFYGNEIFSDVPPSIKFPFLKTRTRGYKIKHHPKKFYGYFNTDFRRFPFLIFHNFRINGSSRHELRVKDYLPNKYISSLSIRWSSHKFNFDINKKSQMPRNLVKLVITKTFEEENPVHNIKDRFNKKEEFGLVNLINNSHITHFETNFSVSTEALLKTLRRLKIVGIPSKSSNMKEFFFKDNRNEVIIFKRGGFPTLTKLTSNRNLRHLNMSCLIQRYWSEHIDIISNFENLHTINVSCTLLSSDDLFYLISSLRVRKVIAQHNKRLARKLELLGKRKLRKNFFMRHLDISETSPIPHFFEILKMQCPNLECLVYFQNNVSSGVFEKIEELISLETLKVTNIERPPPTKMKKGTFKFRHIRHMVIQIRLKASQEERNMYSHFKTPRRKSSIFVPNFGKNSSLRTLELECDTLTNLGETTEAKILESGVERLYLTNIFPCFEVNNILRKRLKFYQVSEHFLQFIMKYR